MKDRFMKKKISLLFLILFLSNSIAISAIEWKTDVLVGTDIGGIDVEGDPPQVRLNIVAPGKVDIAWHNGGIKYSYWDSAISETPSEETAWNLTRCSLAGIGRDSSDIVRIGSTSTDWSIWETYQDAGGWGHDDTGLGSVYYHGCLDYEINPSTDKGEFACSDDTVNEVRHIYRSGSSWYYEVVRATEHKSSYPDMVFDSNGIAYFLDNGGFNPSTSTYYGGTIGDMTLLTTVHGSRYKSGAIDEHDGTLYALAPGFFKPRLYTKSTTGGSWTEDVNIPLVGYMTVPINAYQNFDREVAVGPDGQIAALFYDLEGDPNSWNLFLAYRDNLSDPIWDITQLTSHTDKHAAQLPDVKFDENGDLYVAYYDETADELHLLTTYDAPSIPARFNYRVPIGFPENYCSRESKSIIEAKVNVVEKGNVDVAWIANDDPNSYPKLKYCNWDAVRDGNSAVYPSVVQKNVRTLGGIGRDSNDLVRIGYQTNHDYELYEITGAGSMWTQTATGYKCLYSEAVVSYSVNPVTGRGEFVGADYTTDELYHIYDVNGVWSSVLITAVDDKWSAFPVLTHDSNGVAYVSANTQDAASGSLHAGTFTQMESVDGPSFTMGHGNSGIAVHNGKLYVICAPISHPYHLFVTDSNNISWTMDSWIPTASTKPPDIFSLYGNWGSPITVDPNSGKIAALVFDKTADYFNIYLAEKDGLGTEHTWTLTQLSNSVTEDATQLMDLKYDNEGNLYVIYYNPADDQLYLVSDLPVQKNPCQTLIDQGEGLAADFNQDCRIDGLDLLHFAERWLQCSIPNDDGDCQI